eukprot:CAMPEP_0115502568 /NCGR_PEP_ID=MMETSP0271-20121206/69016_1 /TAXON_ID=71861 /ORGANISM="Scrippsiella trochoidea, Strain CCMP3099" /LENGTH=264 /DNA_ID=CAMNT_0002931609 /DNA_START=182 /DNA_END=972 /DNA_ORIENTATION=+
MVLGLVTVWTARSVEGFSRKTQVLYQTVYITRYLDVFTQPQGLYLTFFKVTFIAITTAMLYAFSHFHTTYDASTDSCNLVAIYLPTALVAYVSSAGTGFRQEMWAYSEFLEPLAMVPQYIVCYRAPRVRPAAVFYVLAVGGYRALYVCNWIYKRYKWHAAYHDYISWFGGALECILFFDFVVRISQRKEVIGAIGASPLGRILLHIDNSAGRLSEKIEMNSIGRRLPFGLSGNGLADDEKARKQWDVSDRLVDEESCQLLTMAA